jgi:hypothetical protein
VTAPRDSLEPHLLALEEQFWSGDANRAKARRPTGEPYQALVSSAYVRRGEGRKLAFHQQTPLS